MRTFNTVQALSVDEKNNAQIKYDSIRRLWRWNQSSPGEDLKIDPKNKLKFNFKHRPSFKKHRSNWKKLKYQDQIIEEEENSDQETSTDESPKKKLINNYLMNVDKDMRR